MKQRLIVILGIASVAWLAMISFCWPDCPIHFIDSLSEYGRQLAFLPLLWLPVAVVAFQVLSKKDHKKSMTTVGVYIAAVLSLPVFLFGEIAYASILFGQTREVITTTQVGAHHISFVKDDGGPTTQYKVSIEEDLPLGFGLKYWRRLDYIYDQTTVEPVVLNEHSFSYVAKKSAERKDNISVIYDFSATPYIQEQRPTKS